VVEHTLGQTRQLIATTCMKYMSHLDIAWSSCHDYKTELQQYMQTG